MNQTQTIDSLLTELNETATWLEERADVLQGLSAIGGPTKEAAAKRAALRVEVSRLRGRAVLLRQVAAK